MMALYPTLLGTLLGESFGAFSPHLKLFLPQIFQDICLPKRDFSSKETGM
jgi:hypothetical protein